MCGHLVNSALSERLQLVVVLDIFVEVLPNNVGEFPCNTRIIYPVKTREHIREEPSHLNLLAAKQAILTQHESSKPEIKSLNHFELRR